jgi:Domain of unknown function (DUF1906).
MPEKRLQLSEAREIAKVGLKLGVVYQDADNELRLFTRERGITNGCYAHNYAAEQIGQPAGSTIYFAVDFDLDNEADIKGAIAEYFRGVRQGFEEAAGGRTLYDIGIYGSGRSCRVIRANLDFVKYSWLALATRWWEYNTYLDWNIKQFKATDNLCGLPANVWQFVEVKSEFGQFQLETV